MSRHGMEGKDLEWTKAAGMCAKIALERGIRVARASDTPCGVDSQRCSSVRFELWSSEPTGRYGQGVPYVIHNFVTHEVCNAHQLALHRSH